MAVDGWVVRDKRRSIAWETASLELAGPPAVTMWE